MARAPRGSGVPKTTGQGISRSSYMNEYKLKGGAIGGGTKRAKVPKGPGTTSGTRDYGKGATSKQGSMNIEFGGMFQSEDVKPLGEAAPKFGIPDKRRENVGYKESGEKYKTAAAQRQGKKG